MSLSNNSMPSHAYDGYRGDIGIGGWWISLVSAQKRCVGLERWWTKADQHGRVVPSKQHVTKTKTGAAAASLPIWLFANGDMYLGEWNEKGPNNHAVEHGFGISYIHNPREEGLVYIGQWKDGFLRDGHSFWLESSRVWMDNRLPSSAIVEKNGGRPGRRPGIPFTYAGRFRNGFKHDKEAVVVLKDGSTRRGPWKANKPVGNWYQDHVSVATAAGSLVTRSHHDKEQGGPAVTPPATAGSKRKPLETATTSLHTKTKKHPAATVSSQSGPSQNAPDDVTSSTTTLATSGNVAKIKEEQQEDGPDKSLVHSSSEAPAILEDVHHEYVAVKQEEEQTEEQQPQAEQQQQTDKTSVVRNYHDHATTTTTNSNNDEEDEARIQKICDWLAQDVIGNNPKPGTMKLYACSLYDLGFESVEMITSGHTKQSYLTEQHVDSFAWMKPLHKQMLLDYLYGNDDDV